MAKRKQQAVQLPSDELVESKKDEIKGIFQQILDGDIDISSGKKTVADKLDIIKSELLLLKDKGIPYSIIKKILEEKIDLKISEQTLRQYCQTRLGFPKRKRAKNPTSEEVQTIIDTPVQDKKSGTDARSALTKQDDYD